MPWHRASWSFAPKSGLIMLNVSFVDPDPKFGPRAPPWMAVGGGDPARRAHNLAPEREGFRADRWGERQPDE